MTAAARLVPMFASALLLALARALLPLETAAWLAVGVVGLGLILGLVLLGGGLVSAAWIRERARIASQRILQEAHRRAALEGQAVLDAAHRRAESYDALRIEREDRMPALPPPPSTRRRPR